MAGPVVVGVDGTESARAAAAWASDLAAAQDAPLRLVCAVASGGGDRPAWLREEVDAALRAGVADVEGVTAVGSATEVLLGIPDARMLVVGSYGAGAASGMLSGFTALSLLGAARCPVAVVRGSRPGIAPPREGPVVVGLDSAAGGEAAVETAAELAAAWGAGLLVLHAWSDTVMAGGVHRPGAAGTAQEAASALLERWLADLRARFPGVAVEGRLVAGTPLRALLAEAPTARVVVSGRRVHRPPGAMTPGSAGRGLVEFATCPVVVTPPLSVARMAGATLGGSR